jgi:glycerol-3-phosphate dehydrogenase
MVQVAEGVGTTASALEIARKIQCSLPIAEGMYRLLYEGMATQDVIRGLMTRRAKYESTGAPTYADSEIPFEEG